MLGRVDQRPRSLRPEVRNPVLALPAATALLELDPATRRVLRLLLLDIRRDARARAEKSWRTRKPPVAAYWATIAVFAGHIARAMDRGTTEGRQA